MSEFPNYPAAQILAANLPQKRRNVPTATARRQTNKAGPDLEWAFGAAGSAEQRPLIRWVPRNESSYLKFYDDCAFTWRDRHNKCIIGRSVRATNIYTVPRTDRARARLPMSFAFGFSYLIFRIFYFMWD